MAVRSLALQVAEAALASSSAAGRLASISSSAAGRLATSSSPGAASATPYYLELCKSEAMIAARRASTGSAARRTALCAVACDPTEEALDKSCSRLHFTAAVVYRVASAPTAPSPPSGTTYTAILSTQGPISAAMAAWEAALEKSGPRLPFTATVVYRFTSAPTAPSPPSRPGSTYRAMAACVSFKALPSASTCIAGAGASGFHFPYSSTRPLQGPFSSNAHSLAKTFQADEAPAELGVDEMIKIMNEKKFNSKDELRFRIAFHKKFFPYWGPAHAAEHLQYQNYTEEEWLMLLRLVYQKAGANADALIVQVKEGLDSSEYSDSDSPAIRRIEVKVDAVLERTKEQGKDLKKSLDMCDPAKKKMEWGTNLISPSQFPS